MAVSTSKEFIDQIYGTIMTSGSHDTPFNHLRNCIRAIEMYLVGGNVARQGPGDIIHKANKKQALAEKMQSPSNTTTQKTIKPMLHLRKLLRKPVSLSFSGSNSSLYAF